MNQYIYISTYADGEQQLHDLFYRQLFNQQIKDNIIISDIDFNAKRSIFIKHKLTILYKTNTISELCDKIKEDNTYYETFQLTYLKHPRLTINYEQRLQELKDVGFVVNAIPDFKQPKYLFGLTKIDGYYYFGYLENNKDMTLSHIRKPHSYSFACGVRTAQTLANLALLHDINKRVIDPCCGSGSVLLELFTLGAIPFGNEINDKVVRMAEENLAYFNYPITIMNKDIANIHKIFDAIILDIPYGVFRPKNTSLQEHIIHACSTMSNHLILLSNERMDDLLNTYGYQVYDSAPVYKGKFVRYVSIAKRVDI